jgi:hypothetical protein
MIRGACQCGGVQIAVAAVDPVGFNCYCEICQKIAGAPFAAGVTAKPGALDIEQGRELLAKYNATPNYDRWHCGRCHSPVYGEVTNKPEFPLFISATVLDADAISHVVFDHIFVRSLVPWHQIGDDRPRHETYP